MKVNSIRQKRKRVSPGESAFLKPVSSPDSNPFDFPQGIGGVKILTEAQGGIGVVIAYQRRDRLDVIKNILQPSVQPSRQENLSRTGNGIMNGESRDFKGRL